MRSFLYSEQGLHVGVADVGHVLPPHPDNSSGIIRGWHCLIIEAQAKVAVQRGELHRMGCSMVFMAIGVLENIAAR